MHLSDRFGSLVFGLFLEWLNSINAGTAVCSVQDSKRFSSDSLENQLRRPQCRNGSTAQVLELLRLF
jgi:hypothetical protein